MARNPPMGTDLIGGTGPAPTTEEAVDSKLPDGSMTGIREISSRKPLALGLGGRKQPSMAAKRDVNAPAAVALTFDGAAGEKIQSLWTGLQQIYGKPRRTELGPVPHISLAVFTDGEPGFLREEVSAISGQFGAFSLRLASVGAFPTSEGVVYLAPRPSPQLTAIHRALHKMLDRQEAESSGFYQPGDWVPHCTVATDVPPTLFEKVLRQCRESNVFGELDVLRIAVLGDRPTRELYQFPLSGLTV